MPSRAVKVAAGILGVGLVACVVLVMIVIGLVPILQVLYHGYRSHDFIDFANRVAESRTFNFQFEYPMVTYTTLLGTKKPPSAIFVTTHPLGFHGLLSASTPPMIARFLLQKFGITARVVCYDNYNDRPVGGKTVERLLREQIRIPRQHPQKLEYVRDQITEVLGRGESVILFCDTHRSGKLFRTFYATLLEHFPQYPKCYIEMKAKLFSRNVHGIFHLPTLEVQKVIEIHNKIVATRKI